MLAFATRTASVLVDDFCFGDGAFVSFPPIGVGTFEVRPTGCVLIGPVTWLLLDMLDNWMRPNSFKWLANSTSGAGSDEKQSRRWVEISDG